MTTYPIAGLCALFIGQLITEIYIVTVKTFFTCRIHDKGDGKGYTIYQVIRKYRIGKVGSIHDGLLYEQSSDDGCILSKSDIFFLLLPFQYK